jgi:hypothetical protein
LRGRDEGVRAHGIDVDRLFCKDMEATLSGGNAVSRVQPGGAPNRDHIHWTVIQERFEVLIRPSPVLATQGRKLFRIGPVDRRDFDSRNRPRRTGVRVGDVSAAD